MFDSVKNMKKESINFVGGVKCGSITRQDCDFQENRNQGELCFAIRNLKKK